MRQHAYYKRFMWSLLSNYQTGLFTKKVKIALCLGCVAMTHVIHGKETTHLIMAVNSPGTRPHLYFNEKANKYQGVIPDLLEYAQKNSDLTVEYVRGEVLSTLY